MNQQPGQYLNPAFERADILAQRMRPLPMPLAVFNSVADRKAISPLRPTKRVGRLCGRAGMPDFGSGDEVSRYPPETGSVSTS